MSRTSAKRRRRGGRARRLCTRGERAALARAVLGDEHELEDFRQKATARRKLPGPRRVRATRGPRRFSRRITHGTEPFLHCCSLLCWLSRCTFYSTGGRFATSPGSRESSPAALEGYVAASPRTRFGTRDSTAAEGATHKLPSRRKNPGPRARGRCRAGGLEGMRMTCRGELGEGRRRVGGGHVRRGLHTFCTQIASTRGRRGGGSSMVMTLVDDLRWGGGFRSSRQ